MTTEVDVRAALARLGIDEPVRADLAGLRTVHRAWSSTVPYENIDIQLGRPVSLAPDELIDKLITRRRGGFCYELNAMLALVLRALGFSVMVVEAAVDREIRGESAWRNHMPLLVDLAGERWIADVGLMDGFLLPVPLRPGVHRQSRFSYEVRHLGDDLWQFRHHPNSAFTSFDLRCAPLEVADFVEACAWRVDSPDSMFVQTLLAGRTEVDRTAVLRARTLTHAGPAVPYGQHRRVLDSMDDLADVLANEFLIPLDGIDVAGLWDNACRQHETWLADAARS
ncbi:arylamine N-acetyltransferase family protein [Actinocrispum wychmicini]|uniref:N-hydroxyarylamine O-acetyltransferase n=1 Tax=Actinocrispum wychmicini TaxID=1213861 RepID=A0A4R2JI27_9PSEU|nr:arylamine N-acetyltransferase [Actinocrispum wychmicini]TCO59551.1 N-hydroxyarylamine O-acetyltransferase [Actinocrispum wychmicini]